MNLRLLIPIILLLAVTLSVTGVIFARHTVDSAAPPSATVAPSPRPAATASPTSAPTPRPTSTPTPSATAMSTPMPTGTAIPTPRPTATLSPSAGYWHTSGTAILDDHGRRVRIAGATWYGMESAYWVPAGLDFQPYRKIMRLVKSLGYNTIRLPISNELIERNPVVSRQVRANPSLRGKRALTVLDDLVRYAGRIGLKIILDDQISRAERPATVNILDEPLWYTKQYPEPAWINDWKKLARRYKGKRAVIGFDLRNEPHTSGPGPWNIHAYLYQGATWGPYHGWDNPATDWRLAAQRAGNAVLSINPHLLIFVEGLQLYPDPTQPNGVSTGWWGWNLSMVRQYPVVLKVPHQLVYSPHDYGPHKVDLSWFFHNTYASQVQRWHSKWGYLLDNPRAPYAAPILLGEFGTCTQDPQCVDAVREGNQAQWFHFLLRFFKEHPRVGWDFFALNGTNANDLPADNGLLNPHWNGLANRKLQKDLASVQK